MNGEFTTLRRQYRVNLTHTISRILPFPDFAPSGFYPFPIEHPIGSITDHDQLPNYHGDHNNGTLFPSVTLLPQIGR